MKIIIDLPPDTVIHFGLDGDTGERMVQAELYRGGSPEQLVTLEIIEAPAYGMRVRVAQ